LNDKCFSGPDLINKLVHVLVRFRQNAFAYSADIEGMYYQVIIPPEDRDALRFLWKIDGELKEFRMTRHLFGGVWCASSSTFALRKAVKGQETNLVAHDTVFRSFYVDDCLRSEETEQEVVDGAMATTKVLQDHGFHLTKFISNTDALLNSLPQEDVAASAKDIGHLPSVLGMRWEISSDAFHFQFNSILDPETVTRRHMLSIISSIYDPLGCLSPLLIKDKMILQDAVRLKLQWDDPVTDELAADWMQWLVSLRTMAKVSIARCIKPWPVPECVSQLHHFSDACDKAFGSCTYLRTISCSGQVHVSLLFAKAKVAPMRKVTIPRLELEAALLSVKSDVMLRGELDIPLLESVFWCDSQIVLSYITNESRRFVTFIANRVATIHAHTSVAQWRFVNSECNAADVISRGGKISSNWFEPPLLVQHHPEWWESGPRSAHIIQPQVQVHAHPLDVLMDHFSDFFRLKRAVAWILRAKFVLLSKVKGKSLHLSPDITPSEMQNAEVEILLHAQLTSFPSEIALLSAGKPVSSRSPIRKLDPFVSSDGLLRVGGRLKRNNSLHPIIISHKHRIAHLICHHYHGIAHSGTEWVVSLIRRVFWVTRIRGIVKSVASGCILCKKLFSPTVQQKMADLPQQRIEAYHPPFSFVGIDCFGPFLVKRARSEVKRYGCLFCCFSTRAIHLELLDSLDCDSFVNAFRRFTARRGQPQEVFSDNGTNFIAGSKIIAKKAESSCIRWHFNPPTASHFGGVWERLIRTVRKVFSAVVPGNARLSDETLRTVFCEVESIVNSRPITHVSDDPNDPAALSPNQLIMLNRLPSVPPGSYGEADVFRRRWRCVQHISNEFWRRWLREYLPLLHSRQKWLHPKPSLSAGDIVLVDSGPTPRYVWPLARVMEVKKSEDGLVRSVKLLLKNGTEILRPVAKCVRLEGNVV
jgi:hypothetical protein